MALLHVEEATKNYGGLIAISKVKLKVDKDKITGLIGPNGAGKTTLFNIITGFTNIDSGQIIFKGENITGLPPYILANKGLVRTFQIVKLFKRMTVLENVMAGRYSKTKTEILSAMLGASNVKKEEKDTKEKAFEILKELNLNNLSGIFAANLSTGQQKILEIARALACEPELLMLDEPVAGLNSKETESFIETLEILKKKGISIFLIEHNMKFIMGVTDFIYVLNFGKILFQGTPKEIINNKDVINAYLGSDSNNA